MGLNDSRALSVLLPPNLSGSWSSTPGFYNFLTFGMCCGSIAMSLTQNGTAVSGIVGVQRDLMVGSATGTMQGTFSTGGTQRTLTFTVNFPNLPDWPNCTMRLAGQTAALQTNAVLTTLPGTFGESTFCGRTDFNGGTFSLIKQ